MKRYKDSVDIECQKNRILYRLLERSMPIELKMIHHADQMDALSETMKKICDLGRKVNRMGGGELHEDK
ncbi:hypothetical protein KAR91_10295 [Candidatus Pacearchaeota archaeon]|nr:hypothetical protein [Candidatus Pacearchaeota archaeon]